MIGACLIIQESLKYSRVKRWRVVVHNIYYMKYNNSKCFSLVKRAYQRVSIYANVWVDKIHNLQS